MVEFKYGVCKNGVVKFHDCEIGAPGYNFDGENLFVIKDGIVVQMIPLKGSKVVVYTGYDIECLTRLKVIVPAGNSVEIPDVLMKYLETHSAFGQFIPIHSDGRLGYFREGLPVYRIGQYVGGGVFETRYTSDKVDVDSFEKDRAALCKFKDGTITLCGYVYSMNMFSEEETEVRNDKVFIKSILNLQVLAPPNSKVWVPHSLSSETVGVYVPVLLGGWKLW